MSANIVILSDRIKELSHTKGQGPFQLDGKIDGFSPFGDFYEYGDVVYYAATDGTSYEVGSGEYQLSGSNNVLTRFPLRSSALDSGPYYLNGQSASGPTTGREGFFYPMFLTRSAALAVAGATSAHTHTFSGYHGVTFYMPNNHQAHAVASAASATGVDYAVSGQPFDFPDFGIKEVYVTYPGKYSVYTGYGISGFKEPKNSGVPFWGSEQLLNYDDNFLWSNSGSRLGITQTDPEFALDIGGDRAYSQIRASGFFGGGSGIYFSGGQPLPQDISKTASGGRQLEPFFRNELDNQTGTDAVFYLSGIVGQRLCHLTQEKGTIYAGPPSGCETVGCSPDYPTFRYLTLDDIPDLSSLYVVQDRAMIDIDPATLTPGAIALYKESGIITYDDSFVFLKGPNNLGIGTSAPNYTLDVHDGSAGISGSLFVINHANFASGVKVSGNLAVEKSAFFNEDVTVSGDLFVKGTTTFIDSTNVTIHDKQLELASLSGDPQHDDMDSLVNDGGILVRSSGNGTYDTGDKKWTWQNANNTWTSQTSNGEKLGITASGMIFNDGSVIAGFTAGSGISIHNNKQINIGNMFKIGAIDSGNAGEDGLFVTDLVHQGDEVGFSGMKGISVYSSGRLGQANQHLELLVDPTVLSGTLYNTDLIISGALQYAINQTRSNTFTIGDLPDGAHAGTTDIVSTDHTIFWSGGDGIGLRYIPFTDSGIFEVDYSGVLGGAGSYDWNIHIPDAANDTIGNDEVLTVSGVSGVDLNYIASTNNLIVSAHTLSGVLQGGIGLASGWATATDIYTSGQLQGGIGLASGWATATDIYTSGQLQGGIGLASGWATATDIYTSGQLQAGILHTSGWVAGSFGFLTGGMGYAGWRAGDGFTSVLKTIDSNDTVYISGISGIKVDFMADHPTDATTSIFTIAAHELSGVLQGGIGLASGWATTTDIYTSGQLQAGIAYQSGILQGGIDLASGWVISRDNYTSGVLQQGINLVSGYAEALDAALPAGSGLVIDPLANTINMDIYGSGQLSQLNFNSGVVRIGATTTAGGYGAAGGDDRYLYHWNPYSVNIGEGAGGMMVSGHRSVNIGAGASNRATGVFHNVSIGYNAGHLIENSSGAINLGYNAGASHNRNAINLGGNTGGEHSDSTSFIGESAGAFSSGTHDSSFIGNEAGVQVRSTTGVFSAGHLTSYEAREIDHSNAIGTESLRAASGLNFVNAIGYRAGKGSEIVSQVDMFGYQAGSGLLHSNQSLFMGASAGTNASGIASGVYIGKNAGLNSSGVNGGGSLIANVMLGHDVARETKHLHTSVGIGTSALTQSSGEYIIALGNLAGHVTSGTNETIMIGRNAGHHSFNLRQSVFIGDQAGYSASGRDTLSDSYANNDIFIGTKAGELAANSQGNNIILGHNAGRRAFNPFTSVIAGEFAADFAAHVGYSVVLGEQAAMDAHTVNQSVVVGPNAAQEASGITLDVNVGPHAGYKAESSLSNIAIGTLAGYQRDDGSATYTGSAPGSYTRSDALAATPRISNPGARSNQQNVIIGTYAGYQGYGKDSLILGTYAGYQKYLENCIVLSASTNTTMGAQQVDWISEDAQNPDLHCVQIGLGISNKYYSTHLGYPPQDAAAVSDATLTVHPSTTAADGIKTQMFSNISTGDQFQASKDALGTPNTIVNRKGFLQIPKAVSKTGSGNNVQLFTADGSEIPRIDGTICYAFDGFGGSSMRLYVFDGYYWYREGTGGKMT